MGNEEGCEDTVAHTGTQDGTQGGTQNVPQTNWIDTVPRYCPKKCVCALRRKKGLVDVEKTFSYYCQFTKYW